MTFAHRAAACQMHPFNHSILLWTQGGATALFEEKMDEELAKPHFIPTVQGVG